MARSWTRSSTMRWLVSNRSTWERARLEVPFPVRTGVPSEIHERWLRVRDLPLVMCRRAAFLFPERHGFGYVGLTIPSSVVGGFLPLTLVYLFKYLGYLSGYIPTWAYFKGISSTWGPWKDGHTCDDLNDPLR